MAVSYGVDLSYSRDIVRNVFVTIGGGYFSQNFGIERPFDFAGDTITNLQYSTDSYKYHSLSLVVAFGYAKDINEKLVAKGSATYYFLQTFEQKYVPAGHLSNAFREFQVEKDNYLLGGMMSVNFGIKRFISKTFSVGADLVVPVYTRWRKDRIFREDESEFYGSKSGIGCKLSLIRDL